MFEKFAALVFLFLMLGLVAFLTFIPMPDSSEKVILIIIGGLIGESAKGVGKLVGGGTSDPEKDEMRRRLRVLEIEHAKLEAAYTVLHATYNDLASTLLRHHVMHDETATIQKEKKNEPTNPLNKR